MPSQTPSDDPTDVAHDAPGCASTPDMRWRATLAAALRVIDHHTANLVAKRTVASDTPAVGTPAESPAGEHEPQ